MPKLLSKRQVESLQHRKFAIEVYGHDLEWHEVGTANDPVLAIRMVEHFEEGNWQARYVQKEAK